MYQLLNKKHTNITSEAWEDFQIRQVLFPPKPPKKVRVNRTMRIQIPVALKRQVLTRAEGKCEECGELGKAIHHILLVREHPELQHEFNNLIFLCIPCHRQKHLYLPDWLFQ